MPERFELSVVSNAPDTLANASTANASTGGFATWSAAQTPVVVRYSRTVLNEIRLEATDKFMSIPRGGVEVGGVLFGSIQGDQVTIHARRPLELEYETGPSFVLSRTDEERLRDLLANSSEDLQLRDLEPVGWYHSHTRSDVFLSPEDIHLHDRFFPGCRQIALVVRPAKFEPARAGFFVREPDGSIVSEASYNEFLLDNALPAVDAPVDESSNASRREEPKPLEVSSDQTIVMRPRPVVVPRSKPRRKLAVPAVVTMAIIFGAAAILALRESGPPAATAKSAPALRLTGSGDNLLIEWSDAGTAGANASRGALDIFDGVAGKLTIPLDRDSIRRGSVTYARNSGNIEVRLRLYGSDSISSETVARYVKPVEPALGQQMAPIDSSLNKDATKAEEARQEANRVPADAPASVPPVWEISTSAVKPLRRAILPQGTRSRQAPSTVDMARAITGAEHAPQISSSLPNPVLLPRTQVQPAPALATAAMSLASGRTLWSGELRRGGILMIDGGGPSIGALNGNLPKGPIRVNVHPAELVDGGIVVYTGTAMETLSEPPSARNGWNLTIYRNDPKRLRDISIVESPSERNNWRLIVRGGERRVGLIVLDWIQPAGTQ
jgi:proteasome lid subunit RPN8/RPN11